VKISIELADSLTGGYQKTRRRYDYRFMGKKREKGIEEWT